jgi:hypothetical protein
MKELYDQFLNEAFGEVKLGLLTFSPAEIIERLDPVAYDQGFLDFEDSMLENVSIERDLDFDRMQSRMADAEMGDL